MLFFRIIFAVLLLLIPIEVQSKQTVKATVVEVEPVKIAEIPETPATKTPVPSKDTVSLIYQYAALYHVDPKIPLAIAKCESGYNPKAQNKYSSASGTFQFINSTWVSTRKQMGEDPSLSLKLDPEQGVKTGVWKIANGGISAWLASNSCHHLLR